MTTGVATLLLGLLVLTGCGAPPVSLGSGTVPVDTPQLRGLKASAHIAPCPATTDPPARGGLPDITLPCLGGGRGVALARLRGPLVVNLWAQWCQPCGQELPIYARFAKLYRGKLRVLGIDWSDHIPSAALQLAKRSHVTYPLLADQQHKVRAIGNGLPQLILVDRTGKIAYQFPGELNSLGQLEKLVAQHLGVHA